MGIKIERNRVLNSDACLFSLEILHDNLLAFGWNNRKIEIWDLETYECIKIIESKKSDNNFLELLNSKVLASCSSDGSFDILNLDTYEWLENEKTQNAHISYVKSLNDKQFATVKNDNKIDIWELDKFICNTYYEANEKILALERIDDNTLAILYESHQISLFNTRTKKLINLDDLKDSKNDTHTSTAFISYVKLLNSNLLASTIYGRCIKIWDLKNRRCVKTLRYSSYIYYIELVNNRILVGLEPSGLDKIMFWDLNELKFMVSSDALLTDFHLLMLKDHKFISYGKTREEIKMLDLKIFCTEIDWYKNDEILVYATANNTIKLQKIGYRGMLNRTQEEDFLSLQFVNKNEVIAGYEDRSIKKLVLKEVFPIKEIKKHEGAVRCLKIIYLNMFASGSDDGTIKFWAIDNLKVIQTIRPAKCFGCFVLCLELIDDDILASSRENVGIELWNLNNLSLVEDIPINKKSVKCSKRIKKATTVASGSEDKSIKIWNPLASGKENSYIELWNLNNLSLVESLTIHEASVYCIKRIKRTTVASGGADKTIKIWNPHDLSYVKTLIGHEGAVNCIEVIGPFEIASASDDMSIKFWNLIDSSCLRTLETYKGSISNIDLFNLKTLSIFFKDYSCVLINLSLSENNKLSLIDPKEMKNRADAFSMWQLGFSNNCQVVEEYEYSVTCIERIGSDLLAEASENSGIIRIWDLNKFKCLKTFKAHDDSIQCLKSISTQVMASCSEDYKIKFWRIKDFNCIDTIENEDENVLCLELLDNHTLASGDYDGNIKIWNLIESDKFNKCLKKLNEHESSVFCLKKVNKSDLVSGSGDNTIKIWNISDFSCKATLDKHTDSVYCLEIIDRNRFASGSADNTIKIWNLKDYTCIREFEHSASVRCLHFNSKRLVSGSSDCSIRFWNFSNKSMLYTNNSELLCLKENEYSVISIKYFNLSIS